MSVIETSRIYSPADLLAMPDAQTCELVNGEIVEKNVGSLSSFVEGEILGRLSSHCHPAKIGKVFPGTMGYQCFPWDPRMVRKPDVSLIRQERITTDFWEQGFFVISPDLAVEVVSPNDLAYEVADKIEAYLRANVPLVWVVYPQERLVMIYRKDGTTARLLSNDVLSGEDIVPGFSCKVSDLFANLETPGQSGQ